MKLTLLLVIACIVNTFAQLSPQAYLFAIYFCLTINMNQELKNNNP